MSKNDKKVVELPGSGGASPITGGEAEARPISNPAKEFAMDPADLKEGAKTQQLQMVIGSNMVKLAQMRRQYLLAEQSILDKVRICESDVNNIIHNFKVKHKIIGEIEGFDLERKVIIIK